MNFKEFYINEMPYGEIDGQAIDFKLERPEWNKRLIEIIVKTSSEDLDKLLEPFYRLKFSMVLQKKFSQLDKVDQEELLNVLPKKFIEDMGLSITEAVIDERKDTEKVEVIKKWTDQIFEDVKDQIKKFIDFYLPKRFVKSVGTRRERRMMFRNEGYKSGKYNTINNLKIYFNARYGSNTLAKYLPDEKSITIYDDTMAEYLGRLNDLAYYYNDEEERYNIKHRSEWYDEASVVHTKILDYLENSGDELKSNMFHELVHHSDNLVFDINKSLDFRNNKLNDNIKKEIAKLGKGADIYSIKYKLEKDMYYNSSEEYNAYYLAAIYEFLQFINQFTPDELKKTFFMEYNGVGVGLMTSFQRFKNNFVHKYMRSFDNFNQDYQKRILKRLYDFYVNIKEVLQQKINK